LETRQGSAAFRHDCCLAGSFCSRGRNKAAKTEVPAKGVPAKEVQVVAAGSAPSSSATLIITEGDSTALFARSLTMPDRDTYGMFPITGKPMKLAISRGSCKNGEGSAGDEKCSRKHRGRENATALGGYSCGFQRVQSAERAILSGPPYEKTLGIIARERCHVAGSNTPKGAALFEANYFVCGDLEQNTGNRTYTATL
jgi:hypothetical protein